MGNNPVSGVDPDGGYCPTCMASIMQNFANMLDNYLLNSVVVYGSKIFTDRRIFSTIARNSIEPMLKQRYGTFNYTPPDINSLVKNIENLTKDYELITEANIKFTLGAQGTFVPTPRGPVAVPFYRGSDLGFDVNLGSLTLYELIASVQGVSNFVVSQNTVLEREMNQSFGFSWKGFTIDIKRSTMPYNKNSSWNWGVTYNSFGVELNNSNELLIGYMPSFKYGVGLAGEVSLKQAIKIKL